MATTRESTIPGRAAILRRAPWPGLARQGFLCIALGSLTVLLVAWGLPFAAYHAPGTWWNVGGWGLTWGAAGATQHRWADDAPRNHGATGVPHAGHYLIYRHRLATTVDFRRVIFVGAIYQQHFYRIDPPPRWAAVISTDMREGFEQVITTATGWPWRCFRGEHWISWRPGPPAPRQVPLGERIIELPGLATDPPTPPPERLVRTWHFTLHGTWEGYIPLEPMWGGLGANVAAWSGLWLLLLEMPRAARHALRRRRGRCTRCGYDLRGLDLSTLCPECGHRSARRQSPAVREPP